MQLKVVTGIKSWAQAWVYILAELAGGLLAGLSAWPLYGTGADYGIWHGVAQAARCPAVLHCMQAYSTRVASICESDAGCVGKMQACSDAQSFIQPYLDGWNRCVIFFSAPLRRTPSARTWATCTSGCWRSGRRPRLALHVRPWLLRNQRCQDLLGRVLHPCNGSRSF